MLEFEDWRVTYRTLTLVPPRSADPQQPRALVLTVLLLLSAPRGETKLCIPSCSIPKAFQLKPKTEPVVFLELFLCCNISAAAEAPWIRTMTAFVSAALRQ